MSNRKHDDNYFASLPVETNERASENELAVRKALDRQLTATPLLDWRKRQQLRGFALQEIQEGLVFRVNALKLSLNTRLQSLEEGCRHVLVTGKTELRQQRSVFFARKLEELNQQIDAITDEFLDRMQKRYSRLEGMDNEQLREYEKQRLEKSLSAFMGTLDKLADDFNHIIDEGVLQ